MQQESQLRFRHRYTLFVACCTFLLVIAGGLVTSTGSALAVPDWPLSYGQLMPPMVGGILFEHGHRMIASFVGVLTVVLAFWYWKKEERRWVRNLALVALGAVILQGILGGLTVLYLLPTPISVSHATLAQTFFVIIASLALFSSRWWHKDHPVWHETGRGVSLLTASFVLIVTVYVQLILGALMRHTESGLAIPDFPLAYGQIVPSLSPDAMAAYNTQLLHDNYRIAADGPILQGQVVVHLLHRFWAVVVSLAAIWTAVKAFGSAQTSPRFKFFGVVLLVELAVQITLGALTVLSRKEVDITTAHVANGALLLVTSALLLFHVVRLRGLRWKGIVPVLILRKEAIA